MQRIAVVGTGTIGASWAAYFLSQGFDVAATDPAPDAEKRLRRLVKQAWPVLAESEVCVPGSSLSRLTFASVLEEALLGASFVQESGPERLQDKKALFEAMDAALPDHVLIASSSSGLPLTEIQKDCRVPGRCVIGHPFNPPYIVPLVEVVAGALTNPSAVEQALTFYASIGKRPVHVRKEVPGFVANRLQAALWREAAHLAASGVASFKDIDEVVRYGLGMRWALMGPTMTFHLAGGDGGMSHFLHHLGPSMRSWWADLGSPELDAAMEKLLVEGSNLNRPIDELVAERDRALTAIGKIAASTNLT